MLSIDEAHTPLLILHSKIYVPGTTPLTEVVPLLGDTIVGMFGPLINVQFPIPEVGLFPFKEIVETLQRL